MQRRTPDLESLLRVPHVDPYGGFDISPDGERVAFSWNRTGRWEIYELALDEADAPRQLTSGQGSKCAPRYAPDGQRLAYALDLDGSESYDLWLHDPESDRHVNLTSDAEGALQPGFRWSPDGSHLAFCSNRSGRFDTYVMPVAGGPARRVLALPHPECDVRWSPDGRWLAITAEGRGQDHWIFLVPARPSSPAPTRLDDAQAISTASGPLPAKDACWSPDATRLAFCSNRDGYSGIGIYELEGSAITWVARGDGDKEAPCWSADGRRLAYVAGDGPVSSVAVLDLTTGATRTYRVGTGVHYAPRFTPGGEHLLTLFENPQHPPDLWHLRLRDGSFRQLTHSLASDPGALPLVMPETVRYPGLDGQSVPALLYRPPGGEPRLPAVVLVHGGPNWLSLVTWSPVIQHMVGRGWIVLAPNYRGSTGYGRAWQLANRFDLGGVDTRDVVAGADYLVREGLADPQRIAVTGRSHGGYLTMTCLTAYPDRWAAGSAVVPFLNWFTAHARSREDVQHWDLENMGDPDENHALWRERSPFFSLDRIQAPVQLICGAYDVRCPASESIQARGVLSSLGKPVELVLYPDEGHTFRKIENVIDAEKRRIAFLDRALGRVLPEG
jgi:dipeptidyl aminopeptidase/acylaminoacyl peptidase